MARLTRIHQKVFASNASNNGVFGSLQAGNPTTSNNVATLQSLSAFENGWDDAIEQGDKLPPLEEFQGLQYGISYQQAYMLQEGIAEWNANTPYYKGSLTKTISGTSFKLYCSLADNNTGNVVTNTTYWKLVMDSDLLYANANLDNLTDLGKNISLWSNNVSNCLKEIPQDIKLELSSGTLTLKSGSVITFPDGTQIQTTSDISTQAVANRKSMILYRSGNLQRMDIDYCYSGSTAPTISSTLAIWYDTTNNVIKFTSDGGATWITNNISFPLCAVTETTGWFTSIDQVFNGFGYIGSCVFALPGVKGLIPDGRNVDGTLKNINANNTSIHVADYSSGGTGTRYILMNSVGGLGSLFDFYPGTGYYNADTNYNVRGGGTNVTGQYIVGVVKYTNGEIDSLDTKPVFHATDYYDLNTLSSNVSTLDAQNVKLTGNQTISGNKTFSGTNTFSGSNTFSSTITGSISGNAGTVTNGVYTNTNQTISGNKTFTGAVALNGTLSANSTVKETITGWAMPSDTYNNVTLADGTYTAPADGYFQMSVNIQDRTGYAYCGVEANGLYSKQWGNEYTTDNFRFFIPVKKGDVISYGLSRGTWDYARFIYAKGEA